MAHGYLVTTVDGTERTRVESDQLIRHLNPPHADECQNMNTE
jgi:hypothetical protein